MAEDQQIKLLKSKSLDYITLNGNVTVAEFKIPDELAEKLFIIVILENISH